MRAIVSASAALVLVLCVGCAGVGRDVPAAPARESVMPGLLLRSADVGGVERRYAVYVPRGYAPGEPWPMVVFLNGKGECGADGQRQAAVGLGPAALARPDDWPCIILFPQKPDFESAWADHEELVLSLIARTRAEFSIDASRIYLTGLSQGGAGTWAIGPGHPELFAALAPVCGYGEPSQLSESIRSMAIWAFHGEADDVVPPDKTRRLADRARELGADVKTSFYPGVNHNAWDRAYRDEHLGAWLLAHSRRRP